MIRTKPEIVLANGEVVEVTESGHTTLDGKESEGLKREIDGKSEVLVSKYLL